MRNQLKLFGITCMATAALESGAGASQPPDPVASDSGGNTAMGSSALLDNTTGRLNTAAGNLSLQFNTTGSGNTALGGAALLENTTGSDNTAVGQGALEDSQIGSNNTAVGVASLESTSSGSDNTALGALALAGNSSGNANTATGYAALGSNEVGSQNTATGFNALLHNTASNNTADGYSALSSNTSGYSNVAVGVAAMNSNTNGFYNTSVGMASLYYNTTGFYNAASGGGAMNQNTTGYQNAAFGINALLANKVGADNIAVGFSAGSTTTGNNNIDIGHVGAAGENGVIRIGTPGTQGTTYLAGIQSSKVTGSAVYVTASGQLGVLASSERYKTAITPMDQRTGKLQRLRPVTFHLKSEPSGAVQYGLIAEEVDKVYPELVIRNDQGRIEGVRYDELAPMLLNVVQQQQHKLGELTRLQAQVRRQQQQLGELQRQNESMLAVLEKLEIGAPRVARR